MVLNNFKCNHLTPPHFKELNPNVGKCRIGIIERRLPGRKAQGLKLAG